MRVASVLYVACTDADTIAIYDRSADGSLELRSTVQVPGGPMWLAHDPQQRFLYCPTLSANEIVAFRIEDGGDLSQLGERVLYPDVGETDASGEPWADSPCPCHCTTDRTGRFLFSSFYTAAMLTVHAIAADGTVSATAIQTIQTSHGCHSVQSDPSNRFVYVPCVAALATQAGGDANNGTNGGNRIFEFALDPSTGILTSTASSPFIPEPTGPTQSPRFGTAWEAAAPTSRFGGRPERGPRHLAFHPSLPLLFTSDEQSNSVSRYEIDLSDAGKLSPAGSADTASDECTKDTNVSEIRVSSDGLSLFCPNRGEDSVATFQLAEGTGDLDPAGRYPTAHIPQAIELTPDGATLYAAGGVSTGTSFPDASAAEDGMTIFRVGEHATLEQIGTGSLGKGAVRLLALDLLASGPAI